MIYGWTTRIGEHPIWVIFPYWWRSYIGERLIWVNALYGWTSQVGKYPIKWSSHIGKCPIWVKRPLWLNIPYGWASHMSEHHIWMNVPYGWIPILVSFPFWGASHIVEYPIWLNVYFGERPYGWTSHIEEARLPVGTGRLLISQSISQSSHHTFLAEHCSKQLLLKQLIVWFLGVNILVWWLPVNQWAGYQGWAILWWLFEVFRGQLSLKKLNHNIYLN